MFKQVEGIWDDGTDGFLFHGSLRALVTQILVHTLTMASERLIDNNEIVS